MVIQKRRESKRRKESCLIKTTLHNSPSRQSDRKKMMTNVFCFVLFCFNFLFFVICCCFFLESYLIILIWFFSGNFYRKEGNEDGRISTLFLSFIRSLCSEKCLPGLFENSCFSQIRRWNASVIFEVDTSKFGVFKWMISLVSVFKMGCC